MIGASNVGTTVHALHAGYLTLPEKFFVTPIDDDAARRTVPSLSFLIQHHSSSGRTTRIVFDLGIRRDVNLYAPHIRRHAESRKPVDGMPDVVASLAQGGLKPEDIDFVIFSHVHWDHIGMPSDFTSSNFVVGNGALHLLDGTSVLQNGKHSLFEKDLLPKDRTIELSNPDTVTNGDSTAILLYETETTQQCSQGEISFLRGWKAKDILPKTMDIFGDGTVILVSAPGHLPGHINLLCLTEAGKYVYLAGDAFHDARLLTGEKKIATWEEHDFPGRVCCIHADIPAAERTISLIRTIALGKSGLGEVEVVFAHDADWEKGAHKADCFFPGRI